MQQSILKIISTALFLFLAVTGVAVADDFSDAMAALTKGEHHEAYRGFRRLAKRDHVESQFQLGMLYLFGQGVKQDISEGIGWLEKAAESGSYLAANELGQIYLSGRGVERNETEAIKWLELATTIAEQNEGEAEDGCE